VIVPPLDRLVPAGYFSPGSSAHRPTRVREDPILVQRRNEKALRNPCQLLQGAK
jgi:hypothetical protein